MTPPWYPRQVYRAFSRKTLCQGDIAWCELPQMRARSGEPPGPGAEDVASDDLPYLGPAVDHEIDVVDPDGTARTQVVRVWSGPVVVVSQNCELEHAVESDSRVHVAPVATSAQWPQGRWRHLQGNRVPGYLYLPALAASDADFELAVDLSEGAVALGNTGLVSRGLVKGRRVASLGQGMLPLLQEQLSRFFSTRGYASERELEALEGKRILTARRTDETVPGPSRLYKLVLGEDSGGDAGGDDEVTVTLGCRS